MKFHLLAAAVLTLGFVRPLAAQPPPPPFPGFEKMTPSEMQNKSPDEQMAWAQKTIGPFQAALHESARRNRVPVRLLTVVLLNELTDYGREDQLQEKLYSRTWTIGIGQTSVQKAVARGHLKGLISEQEIATEIEQNRKFFRTMAGDDPKLLRDVATDYIAWRKLLDPPTGIEVAAREVSRLMDLLSEKPDGPWAKHFLKGPLDRANPYANVKAAGYPDRADLQAAWEKKLEGEGKLDLHREVSLALAVVAAYNSESILTANVDHVSVFQAPLNGVKFFDARAHAINAVEIWVTLLHQRKWPPKDEIPQKKPGEKYSVEYYDKQPRMLKRGYQSEADAQRDAVIIAKFADEVKVVKGPGTSFDITGKGWCYRTPGEYSDPNHPGLAKALEQMVKEGYRARITSKPNWALWTLDMSGRIDLQRAEEYKK